MSSPYKGEKTWREEQRQRTCDRNRWILHADGMTLPFLSWEKPPQLMWNRKWYMSQEAEHNDGPLIFFHIGRLCFCGNKIVCVLECSNKRRIFPTPWIPVPVTIMDLPALLGDRIMEQGGSLRIQKRSKSLLNMFPPKGRKLDIYRLWFWFKDHDIQALTAFYNSFAYKNFSKKTIKQMWFTLLRLQVNIVVYHLIQWCPQLKEVYVVICPIILDL